MTNNQKNAVSRYLKPNADAQLSDEEDDDDSDEDSHVIMSDPQLIIHEASIVNIKPCVKSMTEIFVCPVCNIDEELKVRDVCLSSSCMS